MKKLISILLAAILVFSFAAPALVATAAEATTEVSDVEMSSSEKAVRSIWALFSKWGPQIKKIMKTITDFFKSLFGPGDPIEPTTEGSTDAPVTDEPTTKTPTTKEPTTKTPTTKEPTTKEPTTKEPTTKEPTTKEPTTKEPTTKEPTTKEPTTKEPTTKEPTTTEPTTQEPTTEPTTQEPTTEEPTTEEPTTEEPTTEEPTTEPESEPDMSKPEFVAFFNEQTSEIVKANTYTLTRNSQYKDDKMPEIETPLLVDYDTVEIVIRSFLGIGKKTAFVPNVVPPDFKDAYFLKNTQLYESDITDFNADNGVYTFNIKDSTNPDTNTTPFSRLTNDFITEKQASDEISSQTGNKASLKGFSVKYTNIKCTVVVENNKIVNIEYSYISEFNLTYKVLTSYEAKGSAETKMVYKSIVY